MPEVTSLIILITLALSIGTVIYFLPTIIACERGHKNAFAIFVLNVLLGWSIIGWAIALIWSVLYD